MARVLCAHFVGREVELAALGEALDEALEGRGGAAFLTGEAGVGKSRLAAELMAQARREGVVCSTGRATPDGASTPYRALSEALNSLLRSVGPTRPGEPGPRAAGLEAVVAPPPARPSSTETSAHGPGGTTLERGEAVLRLVRAEGAERGLVLVLEDLHWSDPDTLGVVEYLADNLAEARVLLLATIRDATRSSSRALELARRLAGRRAALHVQLAPLGGDDVEEMIARCSPDAGSELVERVRASAEGLPLLSRSSSGPRASPGPSRRSSRSDWRPSAAMALWSSRPRRCSAVDSTGTSSRLQPACLATTSLVRSRAPSRRRSSRWWGRATPSGTR